MEAGKFLVERAAGALFLDPGARKTSIVLAAFTILRRKKLIRRMVVTAPARVCQDTWQDEVAKWADFCGLKTVHLTGPKKDELLDSDADIFIVSYNSLEWFFDVTKKRSKSGKVTVFPTRRNLDRTGADLLVCDELSKARNTGSLTYKILKEVRDYFARVWGMTGSPAPKSLMNLFGIMMVVDGGYSFGPYITHYRSAYFLPSGYGGYDYQLQPGAEKRIYERIAPFVFRLNDKDVSVKLPALVENIIKVDLPPKARKVYDDLEDDFFTELEGVGIAALNGGAAYGKCKQVANGGLYKAVKLDAQGNPIKGPREWFELHQAKAEAVGELVEELQGTPALVVYDYGHDLERLLKVLGGSTPVLGGGTSAKEGSRILKAWNDNDIPSLLVHGQSVAHGLNMQKGHAHHVIWHSLTDDYEIYDQLIRRLRRSGNLSPQVTSHLLVARNTVDVLSVRRTAKKGMRQAELNAALREYTIARRRRRK